MPALVAFAIDYVVRGRQKALLSARSVPYSPAPSRLRDALLLAFVVLMSAILLLIVGMAVFGSLVKVYLTLPPDGSQFFHLVDRDDFSRVVQRGT